MSDLASLGFGLVGLGVLLVGLLVVILWPMTDAPDAMQAPHGDIPFIPSAGVALRPDAGGLQPSPQLGRPPAAPFAGGLDA